MDINDLRSLLTVVFFITFLGIVWWAYSGHRKAAFEEAAQLPFAEDDAPGPGADQKIRENRA